jgi:hypothetical protein
MDQRQEISNTNYLVLGPRGVNIFDSETRLQLQKIFFFDSVGVGFRSPMQGTI